MSDLGTRALCGNVLFQFAFHIPGIHKNQLQLMSTTSRYFTNVVI